MKVKCNQCGKIVGLMLSYSIAVDQSGEFRTYNFCSEQHMEEFAKRRGTTRQGLTFNMTIMP